jgi:hypothetical protein
VPPFPSPPPLPVCIPPVCSVKIQTYMYNLLVVTRVELLPGFKFTGKSVKKMEFTGKIDKTGKR